MGKYQTLPRFFMGSLCNIEKTDLVRDSTFSESLGYVRCNGYGWPAKLGRQTEDFRAREVSRQAINSKNELMCFLPHHQISNFFAGPLILSPEF
jgi:hypothetical protein